MQYILYMYSNCNLLLDITWLETDTLPNAFRSLVQERGRENPAHWRPGRKRMSRRLDRGEETVKPVTLSDVNLYICHVRDNNVFCFPSQKGRNDCLWLRFILKWFIFTCPFCNSLLTLTTLTSIFQLLYCFSESHLSSN